MIMSVDHYAIQPRLQEIFTLSRPTLRVDLCNLPLDGGGGHLRPSREYATVNNELLLDLSSSTTVHHQ